MKPFPAVSMASFPALRQSIILRSEGPIDSRFCVSVFCVFSRSNLQVFAVEQQQTPNPNSTEIGIMRQ
jgi:hypothetical protein